MSECSVLNINDVLQGDNKELIVHILGSKMYKDREGQYTIIATSVDTFCAAKILNHYFRAAQIT